MVTIKQNKIKIIYNTHTFLICSQSLHLFDKKCTKNNNIMKLLQCKITFLEYLFILGLSV